ncbi:polysaccharide pyruvyl transferase family protein [Virgibacillus sp. FSP13]
MKKAMIYAYTQFNLGDDLFIKVLCERYPDTTFMLYAPSGYKRIFKELPNVHIIPSDKLLFRGLNFIFRRFHIYNFTRRMIARSCEMVIQIGGSLFIQGENWREELKSNKTMKPKDKPMFLLGANFGPFDDKDFYTEYTELFRTYTDICFREQYSYDLFNDLPRVRMADDIIFQMKKPIANIQEKRIVLSVIKPSIRKHLANYDTIYYQKMSEIAIFFMKKGYYVTLMAFCEMEQDDEAVEMIMKQIPRDYKNSVTKHVYQFNIDETLTVIAKSSFVVASRFHAMILGWVMDKAVFPIVYSNKMTNVMQDAGFNGSYADFNTIHTLEAEEVFASMETNKLDITKQVQQAEKHFEVLDHYLKKD